MPVSKHSLRHGGPSFAVIPNATIEMVADADGLAILTYLLAKPDDWTIRKTDIKGKLGVGEVRYRKAMKLLRDLGLIWDKYYRNEAGHITGTEVWVGASPICKEPDNSVPKCKETDMPVYQHCGEPTPLQKKDILQKKDKYIHFDQFWQSYPRKEAKQDAKKAWGAVPETEKPIAIEHLRVRSWPDDRKFIPLPASFIRGKRWEDEQAPAPAEVSYL